MDLDSGHYGAHLKKVLASFSDRFIAFMSMNKTILIPLILSCAFTPIIQPRGAELKEASYYLTARFPIPAGV